VPRSPRHLGYDYTVQKWKLDQNGDQFPESSRQLWEDAATKPDLTRFFNQAEILSAVNGMYFGKISKIGLAVDVNCQNRLGYGIGSRIDYSGVTLLHLLQDLFDHDEPPLLISS